MKVDRNRLSELLVCGLHLVLERQANQVVDGTRTSPENQASALSGLSLKTVQPGR
jgi:hypothetical protein